MAWKKINDTKLTAIADAIRAKTGGTAAMTLDAMPTEIAAIETGGGAEYELISLDSSFFAELFSCGKSGSVSFSHTQSNADSGMLYGQAFCGNSLVFNIGLSLNEGFMIMRNMNTNQIVGIWDYAYLELDEVNGDSAAVCWDGYISFYDDDTGQEYTDPQDFSMMEIYGEGCCCLYVTPE